MERALRERKGEDKDQFYSENKIEKWREESGEGAHHRSMLDGECGLRVLCNKSNKVARKETEKKRCRSNLNPEGVIG